MEEFLVDFTFALEEQGVASGIQDLDYDTVNLLIKSMDTEYDKNVLRTILALSHTRPELYNLGINATSAKQHICEITEAAKECEDALIEGENLVRTHLLEKQERLQQKMVEADNTLKKKQSVWPEKRVKDLEESILLVQEQLRNVESQLKNEDDAAIAKTRQAAKRRAKSLIDKRRVKKRKLGAGRPAEIAEDEEEHLLKSIEEMSTAHGRRHDTVMYMHHRVKARDVLKIVNQKRIANGKRPLKAVSTVLARGKPKRKNSIQSKRHMGQ